ncbi:MAG: recombinase family protein, partial [Pseudonocardiaceae bacterium]
MRLATASLTTGQLEGDTLVVTELSRLGRSLQDLITIVTDLRRRQVGFRS